MAVRDRAWTVGAYGRGGGRLPFGRQNGEAHYRPPRMVERPARKTRMVAALQRVPEAAIIIGDGHLRRFPQQHLGARGIHAQHYPEYR